MKSNRIVRTNDRIIGGVCGALGRKFNVSAKLVRVIFVIAVFIFSYIPVIAYTIFWISIPYENIPGTIPSKFSLSSLFDTRTLPKWFVRFSYGSLYPIAFWPLIFFASIFLFDHPENFLLTLFYFILMVSYPIIFLAIIIASFKIYPRQKVVAILLPFIPFLSGLVFLYLVFISK